MKKRLDQLLTEQGQFPSREKAKAAVMAGLVTVDGKMVDKSGTLIPEESLLAVKAPACPYVGRGGLKLAKGLTVFGIDLEGRIAIDMGASTGGFTDCMLQKGAAKVYAIDVGYGQLDWKLRQDPRVVNMEKTNIRYLDTDFFPEKARFISIDVSFISLNLILPVAAELLARDGDLVCLVKPQFEAGRDQVGKGGIVRDKGIHKEVILKVMEYGRSAGLFVAGLTASPIKGAKGNKEYLLHFNKREEKAVFVDAVLEEQEA